MHPVVALEKSTLRRMSWNFPSCCRVSPKLSASPDFYIAEEELVAMGEDRFIAAGRDLDTTLSSFLFLYPLRHCGAGE